MPNPGGSTDSRRGLLASGAICHRRRARDAGFSPRASPSRRISRRRTCAALAASLGVQHHGQPVNRGEVGLDPLRRHRGLPDALPPVTGARKPAVRPGRELRDRLLPTLGGKRLEVRADVPATALAGRLGQRSGHYLTPMRRCVEPLHIASGPPGRSRPRRLLVPPPVHRCPDRRRAPRRRRHRDATLRRPDADTFSQGTFRAPRAPSFQDEVGDANTEIPPGSSTKRDLVRSVRSEHRAVTSPRESIPPAWLHVGQRGTQAEQRLAARERGLLRVLNRVSATTTPGTPKANGVNAQGGTEFPC
jgi:hypothetical protein